MDVATLTGFLREAEERHGPYERIAHKHHWSDWYAGYIAARQEGRTPDEAIQDAGLHMDRVLAHAPIRVNLIAAGFVDTPLSATLLGDQLDARREQLRTTLPIGASALMTSKIVKGSTLNVLPGLPHGLCTTHKEQINSELLSFLKGART